MAAITVRLSDDDHKLLQLYCLMTGKSQNVVLTDLLRAELDRALPGKREAVANHDPGAFWQAIGIAPPEAGGDADNWARAVIAGQSDEAAPTSVRLDSGSSRPSEPATASRCSWRSTAHRGGARAAVNSPGDDH